MSEDFSTDPYNPSATGRSSENKDTLNSARAGVNAAFQTARDKSGDAYEQAEGYIRKSPLEAVGYAAGFGAVLGLIIGMLMGRRR